MKSQLTGHRDQVSAYRVTGHCLLGGQCRNVIASENGSFCRKPARDPKDLTGSLLRGHGLKERSDLRLVDQGFFEPILRIEDSIGFVTVLVDPCPGHLLLPSPGHADGSGGCISLNIDVVTAPGATCRVRPSGHVPRLPCLDLV